jgi:hypothetical protein
MTDALFERERRARAADQANLTWLDEKWAQTADIADHGSKLAAGKAARSLAVGGGISAGEDRRPPNCALVG